jgi:hypothetical protein
LRAQWTLKGPRASVSRIKAGSTRNNREGAFGAASEAQRLVSPSRQRRRGLGQWQHRGSAHRRWRASVGGGEVPDTCSSLEPQPSGNSDGLARRAGERLALQRHHARPGSDVDSAQESFSRQSAASDSQSPLPLLPLTLGPAAYVPQHDGCLASTPVVSPCQCRSMFYGAMHRRRLGAER